uniref:Rho guanine nucleotide exchange factor 33 n=3 Tax=Boreoeutheria TaxID=1437010 RepID=A0A7N9IEE5_MACFA
MHLEDTTRFCPKEERESEQTSFSDQNPRQDQKGGFRSSFRKLFKKKGLFGWWPHTPRMLLRDEARHGARCNRKPEKGFSSL